MNKKDFIDIIMIIRGVKMKKRIKVILFLLVIILLSGCGKNIDESVYKASDVSFSCTYEESNEIKTIKRVADFVFNTKDKYKARVYFKTIYTYQETISDEKYQEIIGQLDSPQCVPDHPCTDNHLQLGVTALGSNTLLDRKDNTIEITYYKSYGENQKATQDFIESTKKEYSKNGFTCQ